MNKERAALVSGASTGIGHATAIELANAGFVVYAGTRTVADADRVVNAHPNMRVLKLDVTDPQTVTRSIELIGGNGTPLHLLVNNAGIAVGGPLEYLPLDDLRRQFDVNVFGMLGLTQAALPLLRETRGRIVTIGSIASRFGAPFLGPYCASKAAVAMLMDSLRFELAPAGIRAILFEFAAVKTPIWGKGRALKDDLTKRLPSEAIEAYAPFIDVAVKQIDHEERVGLDPALVAKAIVAASVAEKPRARYVVGKQAHVQAIVAALPHRLRDRMVRNVLGIP